MTYELRHHSDDTFLIEFRVSNTGTKTADDFYWLVFTPVNEFHELLRPDVTSKVFPTEPHVEIEAAKYRKASVYYAEPLYPGRQITVAVSYLMKEKAKVPFAVWWQITSGRRSVSRPRSARQDHDRRLAPCRCLGPRPSTLHPREHGLMRRRDPNTKFIVCGWSARA
jgi:hypothetical protein